MDITDDSNYLNMFKITTPSKERAKIQNLCFSIDGNLYSYTIDDSLKIFSTKTKELKNIITVEIDKMKYFQEKAIIHSKDNNIYYLSIYDNKYLAKFDNMDRVNNISVSPYEDIFMTGSSEQTNIWDIRFKNPALSLSSKGRIGTLGYDNEYAFADNNFIYIFDRRNTKGPVVTNCIPSNFYKEMAFTYEGSAICLSARRDSIFLNSSGEFRSRVTMEKSWAGDIQEDSNTFIYATSNMLFAYRILSNERVGQLSIPFMDHCTSLKCSPSGMSFIFSTPDGSVCMAEKEN